jgi:hypothetical protein
MYWTAILFIVIVALLVSGLIGALPGLVLGLVLAAGAVLFFVLTGRDADSPQLVTPSKEPTGEVRGGSGRFSSDAGAETANERIGQQ